MTTLKSELAKLNPLSPFRSPCKNMRGTRLQAKRPSPFLRHFRFETLEPRNLLAITVNTLVDELDGSIDDGDISLRDAIALAPAGATIDFDAALTSDGPATIQLLNIGGAELTIFKGLTILGPGSDLLAIVAHDPTPTEKTGDGARVFYLGGPAPIFVEGLTISGGDAFEGGGLLVGGEVTLVNSTVSGNSAIEHGGGISVATNSSFTCIGCEIRDNSAGSGGGISSLEGLFSGIPSTTSLINSVITGNIANGGGSGGGGVVSGWGGGLALAGDEVHIEGTTIHDNSATYWGGGLFFLGDSAEYISLRIEDSLISGNEASSGGGLFNYFGRAAITNSTISDNTADRGGGIYSSDSEQLFLSHSTVYGNHANENGGGLYLAQGLFLNAVRISHTIVAGNDRGVIFRDDILGPLSASFSLVGDASDAVISDEGNNLLGTSLSPIDPLLGPLEDNGGPTLTHALLPGSPAIDAGDPTAVAGMQDVPLHDQRGNLYTRVYEGLIDIGAYEYQLAVPSLPGDYDLDEDVDGRDFLEWQRQFGTMRPAFSGADGNGNGIVDAADYAIWRDNYGRVAPSNGLATVEAEGNVAAFDEDDAEISSDALSGIDQLPLWATRVVSPSLTKSLTELQYVVNVDQSLKLLLLQSLPRREENNSHFAVESIAGATGNARDRVFTDLGEGLGSFSDYLLLRGNLSKVVQ